MPLFRRDFTWQTSLTPDQVRDALAASVKPGKLLAWDPPSASDKREMRGEVSSASFQIIRRDQHRNSFSPVLSGTLAPIEGGTELAVGIHVHQTVMTFVSAWVLTAAVLAIWVLDAGAPAGLSIMHGVLAFPLLAPMVAWLGFSLEVPKAVEFLQARAPPRPLMPSGIGT